MIFEGVARRGDRARTTYLYSLRASPKSNVVKIEIIRSTTFLGNPLGLHGVPPIHKIRGRPRPVNISRCRKRTRRRRRAERAEGRTKVGLLRPSLRRHGVSSLSRAPAIHLAESKLISVEFESSVERTRYTSGAILEIKRASTLSRIYKRWRKFAI